MLNLGGARQRVRSGGPLCGQLTSPMQQHCRGARQPITSRSHFCKHQGTPHRASTVLRASKPAQGQVEVAAPATSQQYHLSYETTWPAPTLHFSLHGGEWQTQPLQPITSAGAAWRHVTLSAPASAGAVGPALQFVITDGNGSWDKAVDGDNYIVEGPGGYRLQQGQLHRVPSPAVLVVSDLDDTLVGDDGATLEFTEWWRQEGVPAGGRLIYNTGRALSSFLELLEERSHVLAEPDLLISSVGTKMYLRDGSSWQEDAEYAARLHAGWNLQLVREAAYSALASVGKDAMHFRPPSEQNEHKVTCGVRHDVVDDVIAHIEAALEEGDVAHRIVISGKGDWRYLDLVPAAAGKLQALQYARQALGFGAHQTVACGDSGNDVDMLQGDHHAVVVGNAQPDLMAWAKAAAKADKANAPLIVDGSRAHGVLEGLQRLGFRS